jgi:hypothetical protein
MQRIQSQYARVFIKIMEEEEGFEPPVGFQDRSLQPDLGIPPKNDVVLLTKYTLSLFILLVNNFLKKI